MRVGVIINPGSGRRNAVRYLPQVNQIGHALGAELCIEITEKTGRIEEISRRIAMAVDVVAVVGGDGTLNGVVNGVMTSQRPDTPVLFLPAGRGKDTARSLPSLSPGRLPAEAFSYRFRKVDVGVVTMHSGCTRYFINESSIGMGGLATRVASGLPRSLGSACYLIGAAYGVLRARSCPVTLDIFGVGTVDLPRCYHMTVANGRYFGGGLQIAPLADMDDGLLDIIAVADIGALEVARALPMLFHGTHLSHPKVLHWKAESVSIRGSPDILIETDGEQWTTAPARFSVQKQALTWVEPT